jgi:hypothetical protein
MKHVSSTFFALLTVLALQVSGQAITLSLDPCPHSGSGNPWDISKVQSDLTHSGASAIDVAWERLLEDVPEGWTTAICDPNQCYAPFADEPLGPGSVLIPFSMNPGETVLGDYFYVQFVPYGIPGNGTVRLRVYEVGNPNNSIVCSFAFDALSTGLSSPAVSPGISFHPNPVRSELRVQTPANQAVRTVEVYNVVGKLVNRYDLGAERTQFQLDLSALKEGMYFARLINASGNLLGSKRFSKVN